MALVKVGSLAELPPGSVMEARVGETPFAVCNVEGELHAFVGICPHSGGPLGHGALHGSSLVCPWHAWEFDAISGQNDFNPMVRLCSTPVSVSGGDILLEIP